MKNQACSQIFFFGGGEVQDLKSEPFRANLEKNPLYQKKKKLTILWQKVGLWADWTPLATGL